MRPLPLLLTLVASSAAAQLLWMRQSSLPTDRTPKMVHAISPTKAFFVGENELIVSTDTAGASFSVHSQKPYGADPFYAVAFSGANLGIISGNNAGLRTIDGGATWSPIPTFPLGSWSYLDFVSSTVVFAGSNGACAASVDGGQTWEVRSAYPTTPVMFGMDFRDANVGLIGGIMAGTSEEGIYKTIDGGRTWVLKATGAANDVLWTSSTTAIADYATTMRRTTNGGDTWATVATGITSGLLSLTRAGNSNTVLGVSGKGDVWRSTNGGFTWVQTFDGPGALPDIWEIHFADEFNGWITGPGGFFYLSTDGGVTWQQKNSGCSAQIEDIHMLNVNYGMAVGHNGYLFRTLNGGSFWDVQKLEVTGQIWGREEGLVAIDVVDANFAVAAGPGGTVFKTTNGGQTWTSIGYPKLSTLFMIYDVDFIDHNLGYVYGVDDDLLHTRTLFRTQDGGATWQWVDLGNRGGGTTLQFVDAQYGWLTADNAFGLRTRDGGQTWTEFYMPTYYTGPEVSKVRFLDRNRGWVVGWNGYVAKTSDGGETWTPLTITSIDDHLFDVVPVSATDIWICGREDFTFAGVLLHSINGGQTWTRQVVTSDFYYPYRMTALPSGDAWFGGFGGAIFRRPLLTTIVEPTAYRLQPGIWVSGGLFELQRSDDLRFVADPDYATSRNQDPITLEVDGLCPTSNPTGLELLLESNATVEGTGLKIDLWDYTLQRWETVWTGVAPTTETEIAVTPTWPLARFVAPGTRQMKARARWQTSPAGARVWRAAVDRMAWRVVP